jgi:hypothetical protein
MDKKAIKKALDHFENDQFVDAKDIISKEISGKRDIFLKDKLGLQQDINPAPKPEVDDKKTDDDGEE